MPANLSLRAALVSADRLTHLQVAVDGRWEHARRAFVTEQNADDALARLCADLRPTGECAIEVFAADDRGALSFCGVRLPRVLRAQASRMLEGLWVAARSPQARLGTIADWWSARPGISLFHSPCTFVEVGIIDAWQSAGPVRVFPRERCRVPVDAHATLLAAASELRAPPGSIVAAEFGSDSPVPHWVAAELGRSDDVGRLSVSGGIHTAAAFLRVLLGEDHDPGEHGRPESVPRGVVA